MKFDAEKLKDLIFPIVLGVAATVGAIIDNNKDKKIDSLIEKIDELTK